MPYEFESDEHLLRPACQGWLDVIRRSDKHKAHFNDVSEECMSFYDGDASWMWKPENRKKFIDEKDGAVEPKFMMCLNKAFEAVALIGPMLYHKNPVRRAIPRPKIEFTVDAFGPPPDPMAMAMGDPNAMFMEQQRQMMFTQALMQQQMQTAADGVCVNLLENWLNTMINETPGGGLKTHSERAITEAIIKGRGCIWTMPYIFPNGTTYSVMSEYDSVDNLYVDPDADCIQDALWVARKCVHPYWQVERDYGLEPGSLKEKAQYESANSQERMQYDDKVLDRQTGKSNDLIVYYKIWSRMGIGGRLPNTDRVETDQLDVMDELLGDSVYLVVAPGIPFPLNVPPEAMLEPIEQVQERMKWPIPYDLDSRFPVTCLDFYNKPGKQWPTGLLEPGLPELRYLNFLLSHITSRVWTSCRSFWAIGESAPDDFVKQIESGKDQAILRFKLSEVDFDRLVKLITQPEMNKDYLTMLQVVAEEFEKRTGLSELLYAIASTQSRSATDAAQKSERLQIRPDYLSGKVEEFMTEIARKEAICARLMLQGADVAPYLGQVAGMLWDQYVANPDVEMVMREMEYRIEAGSARRPNKDQQISNINQIMPQLMPIYSQYMMMAGDPTPMNTMIAKWCKASDEDPTGMFLQPPPPPPMPAPGQEGGGEEGGPPEPKPEQVV